MRAPAASDAAPPVEPAVGEQELAAAARRGERKAFETLVRVHRDFLYRFIRRYVGDADDAYDLLQETFISAWLALRRFDTRQPFGSWLRAIALNKCRDHGRRGAARRRLLSLFAAEPTTARSTSPDGDNSEYSPQAARLRRLDRAVAQLPPFYKEPLLLTTTGGMTQLQAAQLLRTTPKAIEMRVRRARRLLAKALGEGPGPADS